MQNASLQENAKQSHTINPLLSCASPYANKGHVHLHLFTSDLAPCLGTLTAVCPQCNTSPESITIYGLLVGTVTVSHAFEAFVRRDMMT
eukprot:611880-Amphidinium_carterae.2